MTRFVLVGKRATPYGPGSPTLGDLLVGLTGAGCACRRCSPRRPTAGWPQRWPPGGGRTRGDRRVGFTFGRTGRAGVAIVCISVSVTGGLIAVWGGYALARSIRG
jgi:hypothetical protein